MKRILVLVLAVLPFAWLAWPACTVRANVGALDAVSTDAGADAASADGAQTDPTRDASTSDGATDARPPAVDAGCGVTFPQEASYVDVAVTPGVPPSYAGGTIAPGTYELVGMRVFSSGTSGTMQVRETIVVRGSSQAGAIDRLTEARNPTGTFKATALHGETSTWEAPNASFFLEAPECPEKDFNRTGQYEATSQTLTLFRDDGVVERKYQRIR